MAIRVERWTRAHLRAGVNQNFEVMAGLNNRFIRNLHACVFSAYKTGIMTTSNKFTSCCTGTGRCCKKVWLGLPSVHISFSKNLVYPAYAEF